jgi:catechol 2,3-dioxygenase-like lactoylglutathione lyase family enzyme
MPTRPVKGPGFHHVAIRAVDFDRSVAFYTEALGFKRAYGWGEGDDRAAMLDIGDGNYVELFAGGKPRTSSEEPPLGHFAIRVPDTDAAFKRAVEGGAAVTMEPKTIDIQGDTVVTVRIAFVKGPDGEVIEFFENEVL